MVTNGLFPARIGGMERHSTNLLAELARDAQSITVVIPKTDYAQCVKIPELQQPTIRFLPITWPQAGKLPGHYIRANREYSRRAYVELARQKDIDIVYSKGLTALHILAEKRGGVDLPPVVVKGHGYEMFQRAFGWKSHLQNRMLRRPVRFVSRNADRIFSYGARISEILREQVGVAPERIVEIPGAVNVDWIQPECQGLTLGEPRRFVFVGRSERRKGLPELASAIRRIRGLEFEFRFVGGIPVSDQMLDSRCHYLGEIRDSERIQETLDWADVLVCPSWSEGMPNVIMEAMARHCAIIASDVGAVASLVDSENGWLIPPGSIAQLAASLAEAITNPAEMTVLRKRVSNERIRNFTWGQIGKQHIDAFQALIS